MNTISCNHPMIRISQPHRIPLAITELNHEGRCRAERSTSGQLSRTEKSQGWQYPMPDSSHYPHCSPVLTSQPGQFRYALKSLPLHFWWWRVGFWCIDVENYIIHQYSKSSDDDSIGERTACMSWWIPKGRRGCTDFEILAGRIGWRCRTLGFGVGRWPLWKCFWWLLRWRVRRWWGIEYLVLAVYLGEEAMKEDCRWWTSYSKWMNSFSGMNDRKIKSFELLNTVQSHHPHSPTGQVPELE